MSADGFTLDAKRNDKPEPNDLWDALRKWPDKSADSLDYYQPALSDVRWRMVDDATVKIFPETANEKDDVWGIHELFRNLPASPQEATRQVVESQKPKIIDLHDRCVEKGKQDLVRAVSSGVGTLAHTLARDILNKELRGLNRLFAEARRDMLESGFDEFGIKALVPLVDEARNKASEEIKSYVEELARRVGSHIEEANGGESGEEDVGAVIDFKNDVEAIVREFARLDGYNVRLRSAEVFKRDEPMAESKSWVAQVRVFARRDDWESADGRVKGSHDDEGRVRAEYVADSSLYEKELVKAEYLEPGCIEANDFNLSAGRYKPFTLARVEHEPPIARWESRTTLSQTRKFSEKRYEAQILSSPKQSASR